MRKNQASSRGFSRLSAAFCLELLYFVPCGHEVTSSYCCSAVSRSPIAKPPPFLGVSSLNLAALRSGHFFALRLLRAGGVAASLMDVKSVHSGSVWTLAAPGQPAKFGRKLRSPHGRDVHVARRSCPAAKIPKAKSRDYVAARVWSCTEIARAKLSFNLIYFLAV